MNGFRRGLSAILSVAVAAFPIVAQAGWRDLLGYEEDLPKALILREQTPKSTGDFDDVPPVYTSPADEPDSFSPSCAASSCTKAGAGTTSYFDSCCVADPVWNVRAGALFLHRSRPGNEELLTYGGAPVSSRDFGLGTATGIDFQVNKKLCDCNEFDLRYFAVDGWNGARSYTGGNIAGNALGFPVAVPLANLDLNYGSRLYSTEANIRHWLDSEWALVGGVRWIELHERASASTPGVGSLAQINTANHLYGMQMGALWRKNCDCWSIIANANAGIYGNFANVNASVPIAPDDGSYNDRHAAFAADLSVVGVYRITNHIAARAGYQLLWLDSVALAPNQFNNLDLPNNTGNTDFGRAFYHGATVGVDVTW